MDIARSLVRGFVWRARMSNGAIFEVWTPFALRQSQARKLLIEIANGGFVFYDSKDVEAIWKTNGMGFTRKES